MSGTKRSFTFSLKPNSKVAHLFEDDDEGPQTKKAATSRTSTEVVRAPSDPVVKQNAEKLAQFVAKNGRSVEEVTRQRNPGNTPFRFLLYKDGNDYRWYEAKIKEFQAANGPPDPKTSAQSTQVQPAPSHQVQSALPPYSQTPPGPPPSAASSHKPLAEVGLLREPAPETHIAKAALQQGDSLAAMEAFAALMEKKAADKRAQEEEDARNAAPLLNETSFDRRRVTAVYKDDGTRGHHMQDFIPKEELAKLLSKTNDAASKAHAAALEAQSRIGEDNVGHRLLQKMGWKEGQGLGAGGKGMAAPIAATGTARDTAGLGAHDDKEIKETDDIYDAYRKRMQLGYKYRPNPLGNPRKQYY